MGVSHLYVIIVTKNYTRHERSFMKKILFIFALVLLGIQTNAIAAANLMDVYKQALVSDPTFQQAIAQRLSNKENLPINIAAVLPTLNIATNPAVVNSVTASGPAAFEGAGTTRGYNVQLNLTQTLFNFSQYYGIANARYVSSQADATLNASMQNLMIRVAQAYFTVLLDEDNLLYIKATKKAFAKQLDQVKQQYEVGLKTITDVYTAEASWSTSVADTIGAENQLDVDRENLRAITGVLYPNIAKLREDFPLVSPRPASIDEWVTTAGKQNWSIKAAQYAAEAAKKTIAQQFAGHLPTLSFQGSYADNYTYDLGGDPLLHNHGAAQLHTKSAQLNLNIPLVAGGLVIAQTDQARYNYEVTLQQLEFQLRSTLTQTRQSYLGIISGISKIKADKQSIKSNISSLEGMEAGYRVGTEILVNVLNQQQAVFLAQKQYATDRYTYVNNLLALKQAAGTLSAQDLEAINAWLQNAQ